MMTSEIPVDIPEKDVMEEEEEENDVSDTSSVYIDSSSDEQNKEVSLPLVGEPVILHKHKVSMKRIAKKKRVFLIQKISRQINTLKSKKGNENQLAKNLRRSERLACRLAELKGLDLETIVSDLIEAKFSAPSDIEHTTGWFTSELLSDKFSFIKFVNSLSEPKTDENITKTVIRKEKIYHKENTKYKLLNSTFATLKPQSLKDKEQMIKKSNNPRKDEDLFIGRLSNYNEDEDGVLQDILTTKKNRSGQRARQKKWEALYGDKANHKQKLKDPIKHSRLNSQGKKSVKELSKDKPRVMSAKNLAVKAKQKQTNEEHPSWVAKKKQAALMTKIDVFSGTKTTFDD